MRLLRKFKEIRAQVRLVRDALWKHPHRGVDPRLTALAEQMEWVGSEMDELYDRLNALFGK